MNKSAVALAADSAVTISGGRRGIKTYETVNKLFELVRGSNVGVMIYANAEINGVPWETVIKTFRSEHPKFTAPHIEDYFDYFVQFVASHDGLLPESSDHHAAVNSIYPQLIQIASDVRNSASSWVTTSTGRIIKTKLVAVVNSSLDRWESAIDSSSDAPWADALTEKKLKSSVGDAVNELVQQMFGHMPLPPGQMKRMVNLSLQSLRKSAFDRSQSGVVVAGFGSRDYLPKISSAMIGGRIANVPRISDVTLESITLDHPGHVRTFAQDEQAWGWVHGITKGVRGRIIEHWQNWVEGTSRRTINELVNEVPGLKPDQVKKIASYFENSSTEQFNQFLIDMQTHQDDDYVQPMLNSVAMLPKDELGVLAESLVNLTSLKQRVSIDDANTVGGAIDVALISIGDGFIWLNRKHYFNPELNPTWSLTHSATIRANINGGDQNGD